MGKVLQIRVSASTPFPEEVQRQWPRLSALAWPQGEPQSPSVPALARALYDQYRFGGADPIWKTLADSLATMHQAHRELDDALAEWQPQEANQASDRLEDSLNEMERLAAASE